jgi:hypothetical protein
MKSPSMVLPLRTYFIPSGGYLALRSQAREFEVPAGTIPIEMFLKIPPIFYFFSY